ncbi:membrane insertase [Saccharomycopsis crataegensis]|uniref:Membrane insertase n=1 Tax=Saccharomycopsis crataegensis TaxID=43959 RepID=A0AAV5QVC7_9ASCO|nr:membrane insertase [Saccharomycopsis crataegensis]
MSKFLFSRVTRLSSLPAGNRMGALGSLPRGSLNLLQFRGSLKPVPKIGILGFARFNSTNTPSESVTEKITEITDSLPQMYDQAAAVAGDAVQAVSGVVCDHIGALSEAGIVSGWLWPADFLARTLEMVSVTTGMPWWGTIATVAIGIRLLMVPFYLKATDASGRMSQVKEKMDALGEQAKIYGNDPMMTQQITQKRMQLFRQNGIKLRYMAAPLVQIPFALGMFGALRKMANYPVQEFSEGGLFWFTDLSAADPYLGLQVLTAATFMMFMRMGGETGAQNMSKNMKLFFTILPLASIPFTMNLSAAIIWYFAINSMFSISQTTLFKQKWFRQKFGLTEILPPPLNPDGSVKSASISEMWKDAKQKSENKRQIEMSQKAIKDNLSKANKNAGRIMKKSAFKKTISQ